MAVLLSSLPPLPAVLGHPIPFGGRPRELLLLLLLLLGWWSARRGGLPGVQPALELSVFLRNTFRWKGFGRGLERTVLRVGG